MKNSFFKISIHDVNQRLDNFCFKSIKNFNKQLIYKLIRKSIIKVNNCRKDFFYKLQYNDIVSIKNIIIKKKNIKIDISKLSLLNKLKKKIIYEDDVIFILNKPIGLSVHSGTNIDLNIIDTLKILCKKEFFELSHRLDKESSGILLFSKDKNMLLKLNYQFKNKIIKKEYLVLVHGNFFFQISNIFIFKDLINNKMNIGYYGKKISNEFIILKRFKNFSFLKVVTFTGRTHQIRVNLAHLGYPIVNDKKYGDCLKDKNITINRLFLHAYSLIFYHYKNDKFISIICNLDNEWIDFLYHLKKFKILS